MLDSTRYFAETTGINMQTEVIDDALRALRIAGSVLLREAYVPPWSTSIPSDKALGRLLGCDSSVRTIAFHLVEFGHCILQPPTGKSLTLRAGEIAICFGGMGHRLYFGQDDGELDLGLLLSGSNPRDPRTLDQPAGTSLLCGAFMLHDTTLNPMLDALPGILHTPLARTGEMHNLSGAARLMADELDRGTGRGGYIIERLLEVICAEAVRAHAETTTRQERNWFKGVRDTAVAKALAAIHRQPGEAWTVQKLAAHASMSPSRFAARFNEAMGESPMAYVTKWRMNTACRKLTSSTVGVDQIAFDVGYESVAAFNRAFKKRVGLPPAAWRTHASS
jgi:AraC-like DNA-binding protein